MKKLSRTLAVTLISFPFSFSVISAAQQTDTPKSPAAKKQAAPTPEKPSEAAVKAEPAAEPKPAIHEASGDKDKDKDKEEHYDMTEMAPVVTHHQIDGRWKIAEVYGDDRKAPYQARRRQD